MDEKRKPDPPQVPHFCNEVEAGDFWDTHSPLDYPDEFEVVDDVEFAPDAFRFVINVELDATTSAALRDMARAQGIPATDLVRQWIEEHVGTSAEPMRRSA